jgi:hypothetical protein
MLTPKLTNFRQQPSATIILSPFFVCVPKGGHHSLSITSSQATSCIISEQNYNVAGKPEGKRPLGEPRRRWEDSIKMDVI